eukprot:Hpha_TRINITY_DN15575_c1_g3::TRINITY_DN15575_c1_g3_i1::g.105637::m.105637
MAEPLGGSKVPMVSETKLSTEEIQEKVLELYMKHRPAQAHKVEGLLERFKGREFEVLVRAQELFGVNDDQDPNLKRMRLAAQLPDGRPTPEKWSGVGLQPIPGLRQSRFEVQKPGNEGGRVAAKGTMVTVWGHGSQVHTGKKFWTATEEKPFKYIVGAGDVVVGWDLATIGMREGEERQMIISADDGYGPKGYEPLKIDPGATLRYVINLIKVQSA